MPKVVISFVAAALVVAHGDAAWASVCVVVDRERDNLGEEERKAARGILLSAFEESGVKVDASGVHCTETYTLYHLKLGKTINVTVSGPRGTRTARSTSLEDLPNHYSQIAKALVTGATLETGSGTTDRQNVTKEQSAPRRVAADNLKYVALGYGVVRVGGAAFGPAVGFGYRKELDRFGIDFSFLNLVLASDSDLSDGINGSWLKLVGMFYQDPIADGSVYYGGGLSWGATAAISNGQELAGSGLQGELVAGYEAFRSSTIRGFVQLNVTLPFYKSEGFNGTTRYTPTASLNLGFGWGKSNVVRVINE